MDLDNLVDRLNSVAEASCHSVETMREAINRVNNFKKEKYAMIKCPICGKECKDEVAMANCILADDEIRRFNIEKEQQEKVKKEKLNDLKTINEKLEEVAKMIANYNDKYSESFIIARAGYPKYQVNYPNGNDIKDLIHLLFKQ